MARLTRRELIAGAAALGATWACAGPRALRSRWVERRDLFAEGVASGDPGPDSVLLWTRVSAGGAEPAVPLTVEVAEDPAFEHVVVAAPTVALLAADHTCRVLVGGLKPARTYWYRFLDERGQGSRIGRTRTAPADDDPRPVRFAFVSCQNVCEGAQNAYRRMLFEDERAAPEDQLAFVLHLGDFVYEVVQYPEEVPGGHRYDRRVRDVVRYPEGEKVAGFRVPASLADYRAPRVEPGPGAAPVLPRHGRPRLRHGAPDRGCRRMRARVHPEAARTQPGSGRRAAALSRRPPRAALACGRAATPRTAHPRRRPRVGALNRAMRSG